MIALETKKTKNLHTITIKCGDIFMFLKYEIKDGKFKFLSEK